MNKDVLMFSGGLDSLIAYFYLNKPTCIYVNLNHRYATQEVLSIQKIMEKLPDMKVIFDYHLDLEDKEEADAFIPLRNLFLSLIGSFYGNQVWMVFQKGELSLTDRSEVFLTKGTDLLKYLTEDQMFKIDSPFLDQTKQDLVAWFLKANIGLTREEKIELLKISRSCYSITKRECGHCPACFRKWISLEYNNVDCNDWFIFDPATWEGVKGYYERLIEGKYDSQRTDETLSILKDCMELKK